MAKEIVMSMPSLYTSGSVFLLNPAMRASKVTTTENKIYIMAILKKISLEVPVAALLVGLIKEFEMYVPNEERCSAQHLRRLYGDNWDAAGNFVGAIVEAM